MPTSVFSAVSLLSDLGHDDESVGVLHAVLADLAPHASITDLTHALRPGDVRTASVVLARCIGYVPSGVVIAAVDAGITCTRRCIAVQVGDGRGVLLGPDNGVIAPAVAMAGGAEAAVVLDRAEAHLASPGALWPARDVLAAVAAQLCNGVALDQVGTPIDPIELLPGIVPLPRELDDEGGRAVLGDVLAIDRTGACQLNVDPTHLDGWGEVIELRTTAGVSRAAVVAAPGEVQSLRPGALALVIDAYGMLSVLAGDRSAAEELGVGVADQIRLAPGSASDRGSETAVFLSPPRP